jgi:Tol biopolymer transport system component
VVFSTENGGKRTVWLTSVDANGGPPKRLCDACGLPQDWWLDSSEVISDAQYDGGYPGTGLLLLSSKTGAKRYIKTPHYYNQLRLSPDGRWILVLTFDQTRWTIFIAPFHLTGEQESEDSWVQITKDNASNNLAAWAPDGRTVYYLSDRDGFRCIWAQHLDPDTKRTIGEAFAVYHSHNARLSLGNAGHEWAAGLSVAEDKMVFSQGERQGAIWNAELQ